MSGYSISVDEVRATSARLAADGLPPELATSEVCGADFGGGRLGARYLDAVHGPLADSLRAFEDVTGRLTESLVATFEAYAEADEDARGHLR